MVESVLTVRTHCVAQSLITVPISLEEGKCGDKCDYFGHIILFSIELINMYLFQFFKIHYIPSVIFLLWCIILFGVELENMSMFQGHEVCYSSAIIYCFSYIIKCSLNLVSKMYFRFSSFITLQKVTRNGNLSIINLIAVFCLCNPKNVYPFNCLLKITTCFEQQKPNKSKFLVGSNSSEGTMCRVLYVKQSSSGPAAGRIINSSQYPGQRRK
jgi:hypothetical protein